MLAVATIDIRVWMSLAYPAYTVALVLLIAVVVVGHLSKGAAPMRWISAGRGTCSLPS